MGWGLRCAGASLRKGLDSCLSRVLASHKVVEPQQCPSRSAGIETEVSYWASNTCPHSPSLGVEGFPKLRPCSLVYPLALVCRRDLTFFFFSSLELLVLPEMQCRPDSGV